MLKIKLVRRGKRNQPFFRIVVVEAKSKLEGKYVAKLGFYNPLTDKALKVSLDKKSYLEWVAKGAQPTQTVKRIVAKIK